MFLSFLWFLPSLLFIITVIIAIIFNIIIIHFMIIIFLLLLFSLLFWQSESKQQKIERGRKRLLGYRIRKRRSMLGLQHRPDYATCQSCPFLAIKPLILSVEVHLLQVEGDGKNLWGVVCSLYNEKQQLYRNTIFT